MTDKPKIDPKDVSALCDYFNRPVTDEARAFAANFPNDHQIAQAFHAGMAYMARKLAAASSAPTDSGRTWSVGDEAMCRRAYPQQGPDPIRVRLMHDASVGDATNGRRYGQWVVRDVTRLAFGGWSVREAELSPIPAPQPAEPTRFCRQCGYDNCAAHCELETCDGGMVCKHGPQPADAPVEVREGGLLPCPFCGYEHPQFVPAVLTDPAQTEEPTELLEDPFARCLECGAIGPAGVDGDAAMAVRLWNMRATSPAPVAELADEIGEKGE